MLYLCVFHLSFSSPFSLFSFFFFLMIRRPPRSTLFPYTSSSDLDRLPLDRVSGRRRIARSIVAADPRRVHRRDGRDRKSTRLNSSHVEISYAVFCLKKKTGITMFLDGCDF